MFLRPNRNREKGELIRSLLYKENPAGIGRVFILLFISYLLFFL